jgi:large subunit ribosomal protein L15
MNLEEVNRGIRKFKKRKRLGRGPGSGHGKTCGRGEKGQKSRPSFSKHPTFQGGAMPMVRRLPKRGFNNRWALAVATVNVKDLEKNFDGGQVVTPDSLREHSLTLGRYDILKVLGDGELTKALTVSAHRFSKTAVEKIEKAGGKVVVLPGKTPLKEKIKQKKASQASEVSPPSEAGPPSEVSQPSEAGESNDTSPASDTGESTDKE